VYIHTHTNTHTHTHFEKGDMHALKVHAWVHTCIAASAPRGGDCGGCDSQQRQPQEEELEPDLGEEWEEEEEILRG
jgi:hypothetical protein